MRFLVGASLFVLACACDPHRGTAAVGTPIEYAKIVQAYPHDPNAYTQGLLFHDGVLDESTGQYGLSSLRRVELETGRVQSKVDLPRLLFGEGLALLHDELFQITWREHECFVYDAQTFAKRRELKYEGEGWGLTTDGTSLIMSDGSATLSYRDPKTFAITKSITVSDRGVALERLNELEWVRGTIWANIWGANRIARIDPRTGNVVSYLDLASLPEPRRGLGEDNVLNGIAFDEATGRLFVTGKNWSTLFEIITR